MGRLERMNAQHPRASDVLEAQTDFGGGQTVMPPHAAGWQAKSRGGAARWQLPSGVQRGGRHPPISRAPGATSSAWAMPLRFAWWEGAPFPGGSRCLILFLGCFPPSAAAFALLVVLQRLLPSPQGRGPGGGRAGGSSPPRGPAFSEGAPAFKAAAVPSHARRRCCGARFTRPALTTTPAR